MLRAIDAASSVNRRNLPPGLPPFLPGDCGAAIRRELDSDFAV